MKQYLGISRDHSRSIAAYGLANAAKADYNDNILAIQEAAKVNELDTIVSVVKCGVGWQGGVEREVVNSNVHVLHPLSHYLADGSATPLWDSVGELIDILSRVPDADDPRVSFLIMVITDGHENHSRRWSADRLTSKIRELQASDRWSFVFRVPRGHAADLAKFGIPEGNILEWEQTARGVAAASALTRSAVTSFFSQRRAGVTSTAKFYADLSSVSPTEVKQTLRDVSDEIRHYFVDPLANGVAIREFVERQRIPYTVGAAFYQLTKTERVQDRKNFCLRDRANGAIYSGRAARDLIGLPQTGNITLSPQNLGGYDVFIQSTSVNRKLVGGTTLLYWPNAAR